MPTIEPEEKAYLAIPRDQRPDPFIYSCSNTDVVVTGRDRFLLAYSDFHHPHPAGGRCKAVITREVIARD